MTKLLSIRTKAAAAAMLAIAGTAVVLAATPFAHSATDNVPSFGSTANALRAGVLRSDELPGFVTFACPMVQTDVADWAGADTPSIPIVRREGFVMGIRESLRSTVVGASATSVAVHFRSSAGAQAEVARQLAAARAHGADGTLGVAGIPQAHGLRLPNGYVIAFTVGANAYELSVDSSLLGPQLASAAHRIYSRA